MELMREMAEENMRFWQQTFNQGMCEDADKDEDKGKDKGKGKSKGPPLDRRLLKDKRAQKANERRSGKKTRGKRGKK
jgi:hypothetical protein